MLLCRALWVASFTRNRRALRRLEASVPRSTQSLGSLTWWRLGVVPLVILLLSLDLVSVCYIFLIGAENIAVQALAMLVFQRVHLGAFKLKIVLTPEVLAVRQVH